jgi:hypothetical protein
MIGVAGRPEQQAAENCVLGGDDQRAAVVAVVCDETPRKARRERSNLGKGSTERRV